MICEVWQIFSKTLESSKIGILIGSLKNVYTSFKFTEDLCAVKMKNYDKFEEELTCRFKNGMRNLCSGQRALKSLKMLHFNGLLLNKVYNVWAKLALKIETKFRGKLTCPFQNDMRNLTNFHSLKWKKRFHLRK